MGAIVRAIGAGVGLIAEATSSNKKHEDVTPSSVPRQSLESSTDDSTSSSEDEEAWALDDTVEETQLKKSYSIGGQVSIKSLVDGVLVTSRPPPYSVPELGMPIILPQRRPGHRGRGFVRAYAPILDNYGIDQQTFLRFLVNFDDAIQASPVLGVVMLGATVAGFVPHGWSMLAGTFAQVVVGAAMEYQTRSRGNNYMDQLNEKLFKPRGLYAVVMTYVPNASRPVTTTQLNVNDLMDGKRSGSSSLLGPKLQRGEAYGELELPEAAPLIFPGISEEAKAQILKENSMKKSARWTQDYLDRRAQARWNQQNPDSELTKAVDVDPTFNSTLGNPNHPAFQGSWPTLFSGGRIPPKQKISKEGKRARKAARKEAKYAEQGYVRSPNSAATQQQAGKQRKAKTPKSKILYLMILPVPSDMTAQQNYNSSQGY